MPLHEKYITETSEHFEEVKILWRRNSQTLGFFPEGAFKESAANSCILVAEFNNSFAGYLLFRKIKGHSAYPQAAIVHLCTNEQNRRDGVAKFLVETLCSHLKSSYLKLKINCRKDYNLDEFWIKLGFVYQDEITGRSGQPLFKWERTFREIPLPLLEFITQIQQPKKFRVVIDANVCYRLQDSLPAKGHDRDLSLEAKALEADWIKEDISLVITDELPNEIQKNNDIDKRNSRTFYIQKFEKISNNFNEVKDKLKQLSEFFPEIINDNDRSDMYQLAHTIAGGYNYFVTQDLPLLKKSTAINDKLGLTIITPGELISHIDELNRGSEYQPSRIAGSNRLQTSKLSSNQVDGLYNPFRKNLNSERKTEFLNRIRSFLSSPTDYEQTIYAQSISEQLAFIVYDKRDSAILRIPIIRIAKSRIAATVLRYVIRTMVVKAINNKQQLIIVSDMEGQEEFFKSAFIDNHFIKHKDKWVKLNIFKISNASNIINEIDKINDKDIPVAEVLHSLTNVLIDAQHNNNAISFAELEKKLHPLKIIDSGIPSYVVPIKPGWAQNLFDETLARQTLWGANENLIMRLENVFYRSKFTFGTIIFPARILWYVTQGKNAKGSKMIRACSYIDEVTIGNASHLFKKYNRLGVYCWDDIMKMTKDNPDQNIMAIVFNNTELFKNPISFEKYREILKIEEKKSPVVRSPQLITEKTFFKIYSLSNDEYR